MHEYPERFASRLTLSKCVIVIIVVECGRGVVGCSVEGLPQVCLLRFLRLHTLPWLRTRAAIVDAACRPLYMANVLLDLEAVVNMEIVAAAGLPYLGRYLGRLRWAPSARAIVCLLLAICEPTLLTSLLRFATKRSGDGAILLDDLLSLRVHRPVGIALANF